MHAKPLISRHFLLTDQDGLQLPIDCSKIGVFYAVDYDHRCWARRFRGRKAAGKRQGWESIIGHSSSSCGPNGGNAMSRGRRDDGPKTREVTRAFQTQICAGIWGESMVGDTFSGLLIEGLVGGFERLPPALIRLVPSALCVCWASLEYYSFESPLGLRGNEAGP